MDLSRHGSSNCTRIRASPQASRMRGARDHCNICLEKTLTQTLQSCNLFCFEENHSKNPQPRMTETAPLNCDSLKLERMDLMT